MSTVRIVMTSHGRGEVFIDGAKVAPVRSVKMSVAVDEANELTIVMIPEKIEIEGEFDVSTIESTERELIVVKSDR